MRILLYSLGDFIYDAIALANQLAQKVDTTLMIPRDGYESLFMDAEFPVLSPKLHVIFFNHYSSSSPRNLLEVRKTLSIIHQLKPDLIHLQPCTWLSLAVPLLSKKYPIITTIHDPYPMKGRTGTAIRYPCQIIQMIFSKKLLAWGDNTKEIMRDRFKISDRRIKVVPYGGHEWLLEWWTPGNSNEIQNTILFFGAIVKHKGLEYLIEATSLIQKEIPDLKVVIAGKGELPRKLKNSPPNDVFEIHNHFLPYPLLIKLINKSTLAVFPYTQATQSGGINMAIAFKKAIVATQVGNFANYVDSGKTGILTPPKNSEKLAQAIIYLLKNPEIRKEMGEAGYNKMRQEFSWEISAEKHIAIYRALVNSTS